MPGVAPIDEDGLTKLAQKARIEREQLDAFRSNLISAGQTYRRRVDPSAKHRPSSEEAELAKVVKSLNKFRRGIAPHAAELREALCGAPRAVRAMAFPPAGLNGETALPEATLLRLPELLGATADYVAERRIAASARIERHRPAGAAVMTKLLAIAL
jgi:hypothetical protein